MKKKETKAAAGRETGGETEARKAFVVTQQYEQVPVGSLKPHPENPRRGNAEAIDESITSNGFYGAIVVQRSSGCILVGKHRWERAGALGIETVPVLWADVDDVTARKIVLADNRTSDLAGYDDQKLAEFLASVQSSGLEGSGYDQEEFDQIIEEAGDAIIRAAKDQVKLLRSPEPEVKEPRGVKFDILVQCGSELEQQELLENLKAQGLTCKPTKW